MRLRRALSVIPCLLVFFPLEAAAQLKLKLSGRPGTKTVYVVASGLVTATTTNNLAQTETWNGYGDFWKSSSGQTFQITSGITVKNETSGNSRALAYLDFFNTASNGDAFSLTSNLIFGGQDHQFSLSGSATFQLQPSQTFAQLFESGTYATENQNPPLGPGPILEISEAPPADIQVEIMLPGGGSRITTGIGLGDFEVVVRITNVGGGFAENVPYSVTLPSGTYITAGSPEGVLSGTISFLAPGETEDRTYYLRFEEGPNLPTDSVDASSSFADENPVNNSASASIQEIDVGLGTPLIGNHITTVITAPPDLPTTITPGTQATLFVTCTSAGGDGPTLIHITPPADVFIDSIDFAGDEPAGLHLVQVEDFAVAVIPPAESGTEFPLVIHVHGQNNAAGNLTVTNAPGTPAATTTSRFLNFGSGTPLYEVKLHFLDDFFPLETPCLGLDVEITSANGPLLLTTDLSGFGHAFLAPGPATATVLATGEEFSFTVPAEDFVEEFMVSDLDPELEVEVGWEGPNEYTLIVDPLEQIPDATVTITNKSNATVSNVPVTIHYPKDPNDGDELGFAEIENPVTGERTPFSCTFLVPTIAANTTVAIDVPFHRRPNSQIPDIFGQTISVRAQVDWTDFNVYTDQDDTRIKLLDIPPFDCEWISLPGSVAAGSPFELNAILTSNGGSGTAIVQIESTVGKILSILVPGASAPVNLQNGTLWQFTAAIGAAGSQYPISVFGAVPSNGAANYTVRVLSTGPGIDESSATVDKTGDATPTVLVNGQVFYDANSNGMVDGGERVLPNWPVRVVDGAGHTFNLQADGAGNWGVFVAAGSGPGQATPGAGGGGAPGAGFGFMPGADDLDIVVGPLELSGRAYVDRDGDAVYTPGTDVPFPGLTAYLGLSSATGQTTTTDADGRYLFTLPPDTPGFLVNPAQTGGVARAHIVGLDEPEGFVSPRPVFGVHYVPDFTVGILPLVSTPLNALDFVMGVEPNLVTFDPPSGVNPKIRWPKRLGPDFIPEFNTTLAPNGWMEITSGRTEDTEYYYADLPAAPDGQLFIRLRRPVGGP